MSLMQNTSEINKTDKQVYLITLLRKSTNMPQYIDHMIYETAEGGQEFMARLVEAFHGQVTGKRRLATTSTTSITDLTRSLYGVHTNLFTRDN